MTFSQKVLETVSKIPRGSVMTCGELASKAGNPRAARATGQILNANKNPGKIPCYRVVRKDGSIGGYSRGLKRKIALLKADGIKLKNRGGQWIIIGACRNDGET